MDDALLEEDEQPLVTLQQWLDRAQRHVQVGEHHRATEMVRFIGSGGVQFRMSQLHCRTIG